MAVKFTTPVQISRSEGLITYDRPVLLLGSCFTDEIGARMRSAGMQVLCNPMGVLYNPRSIALCLRRAWMDEPIDERYLVEYEGLWHSWLHHGSFSRPDKQQTLDAANRAIHETSLFLKQRPIVIVTWGTAWAYHLRNNDIVDVVANCHKVPAQQFVRSRLSVADIVGEWEPLLEELGMDVIFTVSPIRHMADGAHGNQVSKATLLLAVEQLQGTRTHYFPSYEIVLDELRDYRFYARDLCHPSDVAVDVIWERFQETYLTEEDRARCMQYEREARRSQHIPLHAHNVEQNK